MALKTEKYRKYYLKCSNTFFADCTSKPFYEQVLLHGNHIVPNKQYLKRSICFGILLIFEIISDINVASFLSTILKHKFKQNQNRFRSHSNRIEFNRKFGIWLRDSLKRDPRVEHSWKFEPDPIDLDRVGCASDASGTAV